MQIQQEKRTHDTSSLPAWAQRHIAELTAEIEKLRSAHEILTHREWFVVNGPPVEEAEAVTRLWFLGASGAQLAFALYPGDTLLVGRARREESDP